MRDKFNSIKQQFKQADQREVKASGKAVEESKEEKELRQLMEEVEGLEEDTIPLSTKVQGE